MALAQNVPTGPWAWMRVASWRTGRTRTSSNIRPVFSHRKLPRLPEPYFCSKFHNKHVEWTRAIELLVDCGGLSTTRRTIRLGGAMANLDPIDGGEPEGFSRIGPCLSGPVLAAVVNKAADAATAEMASRHIVSCWECAERFTMLYALKSQRVPVRSPFVRLPLIHWRAMALSAAALLIVVGGATHLRRGVGNVPEADRPIIYRSAQFHTVAPLETVAAAPPAFVWEPVSGAASYEVRLMDVDQSPIWSATTSETSLPTPAPVQRFMTGGRGFFWTVVARNQNSEKISETNLQKLYIRPAGSPRNRGEQ